VKADEWEEMLQESLQGAIISASVEVLDGQLSPFQVGNLVNREQLIVTVKRLLALTYEYSKTDLPEVITNHLAQLPGGENWKEGRRV